MCFRDGEMGRETPEFGSRSFWEGACQSGQALQIVRF